MPRYMQAVRKNGLSSVNLEVLVVMLQLATDNIPEFYVVCTISRLYKLSICICGIKFKVVVHTYTYIYIYVFLSLYR